MFITKLLRQFSHGRITEVMPVGRTKSCGATRESSILSFGTSSFCNFSFRKKAEAVLLSAFVQSLAIPHKTRLAGLLRGPRRLLTVSESSVLLQSISYALSCKATLYPTKNPLLAGPVGSRVCQNLFILVGEVEGRELIRFWREPLLRRHTYASSEISRISI